MKIDKQHFTDVGEVVGIGWSYATFGELLQGFLKPPNGDFLVTSPIHLQSKAFYFPEQNKSLTVVPSTKTKSLKLAKLLLTKFNLPHTGILLIESEIPNGKGMASSSADLVATARAIAHTYNIILSKHELSYLMKQIEPSDGVMYKGVVSYRFKDGEIIQKIPTNINITIISIDDSKDEMINTIEFNKSKKNYTESEVNTYQILYQDLKTALVNNDYHLLGQITTKSCIMNQRFLIKKSLDKVVEISETYKALGVICAHSGTMLGIMLATQDSMYYKKLLRIADALTEISPQVKILYSRFERDKY